MENTRKSRTLRVEGPQEADRLDRWLTERCPDLSRSAIKKLIDAGDIRVEGVLVRASHRVVEGERVEVRLPEAAPLDLIAEDVPLDVVFEDEWLLVVNKPVGMTVHPVGSLRSGTLVNALLGRASLSSVNGELRPGIVHRLDRNTSGLLVVAKDDATHRALASGLEAREIHRQYLAICWGHPADDEGSIETSIGRHARDRRKMAVRRDGRRAVSHYRVTARYDFLSRVEVTLETGRTHQIRVHFDHIGHPIFGDHAYNGGEKRLKGISPLFRNDAARLLKSIDRQMLHAERLAFQHPATSERLALSASPPHDMAGLFRDLDSGS